MTLQKAESENKKKSRSRFNWIYRVMTDPVLHANAKVLAVVIANHADGEGRDCYPSQVRLGDLIGVTPKTVQNLLPSLVERGYIEVTPGVGRGVTHEYRIKDETDFAISIPEKAKLDSPYEGEKAKPVTRKGETGRTEKAKPVSVKPVIEPVKEPVEYISRDFDRFWDVYPKRKSKPHAQKAFAKACKVAPAERIIAGAERYAAERQGKDATYTKHPASWLNAHCWEDDPEPSGRQMSLRDASALRGAFGHVGDHGGEHDLD